MLRACDKALVLREKQLNDTTELLYETKKLQKSQEKELEEANRKLGSMWRNPFVMIGLGLVLGVAVTK